MPSIGRQHARLHCEPPCALAQPGEVRKGGREAGAPVRREGAVGYLGCLLQQLQPDRSRLDGGTSKLEIELAAYLVAVFRAYGRQELERRVVHIGGVPRALRQPRCELCKAQGAAGVPDRRQFGLERSARTIQRDGVGYDGEQWQRDPPAEKPPHGVQRRAQ